MDQQKSGKTEANRPSIRASLLMLGFGLSILALLIGIDRAHWFKMRPVSTGAAAMWHAADSHKP